MTGSRIDPLADYHPNWRQSAKPAASEDDPLADYHPDWRKGVLSRAGGKISAALEQLVTHPLQTIGSMVSAPVTSAASMVAPSIEGAERFNTDPQAQARNVARFGGELHASGVTGKERLAAIAQTAANIAMPGVVGGVSRGATNFGANKLLSNAAGVAAAGTMAGAAYDPDDPLAGGLAGGTMGAFLGTAVPPAVNAASRGTSSGLTALGLRPSGRSAVEMLNDANAMRAPVGPQAQSAIAENTAPRPPRTEPTPLERVRAATGRVVEKAGIESSKTRALREIARRFELDNVTPSDALAFAERAGDKPVAVLDLGAGNVSGLARTAKDVPSLARRQIPEFLHERSSGNDGATLGRVVSDFEQRIGLAPEDYFASIDDMTKRMKDKASTDYGSIRNQLVDDPEVLSLFDEPEFATVHTAIRNNARLRRSENIPPLRTASETVQAADRGGVPDVLNPQTLGTLDKMKRHIDQIISGKIEGGSIQRDAAYAMRDRLNDILGRMDELYPQYGEARANYRGSAEAIEAYEAGKGEFLKLDPRAIRAKLEQMPDRLRDLYRRGGYDALRSEKLNKMEDGANIGAFLEKNPDIRERVAALAKTADDASALRGDLGIERAMGDRKNAILGGPNTAERIIDHESTKPMVTHLGNAARYIPGVGKLAGAAIDNALFRRTAEQTAGVMGEVGKIMTRSGRAGIQLTMDDILKLMAEDALKASKARAVGDQAMSRITTGPQQRRP